MLNVSKRNNFHRKTSNVISPENGNMTRKVNRNRSSILINGNNYVDFFSFAIPQSITQQPELDKVPNHNFNANTQTVSNLRKISKNRVLKNTSTLSNNANKHMENIKFKQVKQQGKQFSMEAFNSMFHSKQLSKTSKEFKGKTSKEISSKASKQFDSKVSKQFISKTQTPFASSLRNSSVKNEVNKLKKNVSIKGYLKSSLFRSSFLNVGKQSQHFEQFLRESNLTKINEGKVNENNDDDKENQMENQNLEEKDQSVSQLKFSSSQLKKSHKILKKGSMTKQRKISNVQSKVATEQETTYRDLFQNLTQRNIVIEINDNDKETSKAIEQDSAYSQTQKVDIEKKEQQLKNAEKKRIEMEFLYKEQTEELFRKLGRQIASKEETERFSKKSNNFYEQLRIKLSKQYEEISRSYKLQDKQKDKLALLIEGCNLERHRRVNNFYFEKKLFSGVVRPQTAGAIDQASKQINNLNFVTKQRNKTIMRPSTSRPKSGQRTRHQLNNKSLTIVNDFNSLTPKSVEDNFRRQRKFSQTDLQSIFCLTSGQFRIKQSIRKSSRQTIKNATELKRSKKVQKEQLNDQFHTLLNKCDDQNYDYEQTKKKMKAFEYYCSKMDHDFQNLSSRINDYVSKL